MTAHGMIHWSELVSTDPAASVAYFRTIAGWEIDEMPMPDGTYWIGKVAGQPVAGIMDIKGLGDPDASAHWKTYIAVDDVDAAVAVTEGAGGSVLKAPFDIPGVGRIAMIRDPGDGVVGLMTPA